MKQERSNSKDGSIGCASDQVSGQVFEFSSGGSNYIIN